jgi:hypothetical protein
MALFSTNPQPSSQQQGAKFCFLDRSLVKSVVDVQKIFLRQWRQPIRISSAAAISTACHVRLVPVAFILC